MVLSTEMLKRDMGIAGIAARSGSLKRKGCTLGWTRCYSGLRTDGVPSWSVLCKLPSSEEQGT